MKRLYLVFFCFMLIVLDILSQDSLYKKSNIIKHDLKDTRWGSRVENSYSNYYDFKTRGSFVFYSGEHEDFYPGVYSIKEDTLFLCEFQSYEDDPFEILDREVRYTAIIKGDFFEIITLVSINIC